MIAQIRRREASPSALLGSALHPVLQRVYAARGLRSPLELSLALERLLPVSTLEGVDAAADLLVKHRRAGRVLVVGDFDADGATSTALIVRALRAWSFPAVDFLVPNRFEFGYGLTPEIVALAAERHPTLIVTVDNGISSLAGVAAARARGIDVLVTDHHLPGACLPDANVIVNPNLTVSRFASRALAGVGVALYVMAGLKRRLEREGCLLEAAPGAAEFLDLVCLGTVADLVPLDANNRVLVAQGLRRIRAGRCIAGIRALLAVAGRGPDITAADLAFGVAPRLNAAGRLDDMSIGIQCLLTDEAPRAAQLAGELDRLNQERRTIEARMQAEALAAVRHLRDADLGARAAGGLTLFHQSWHQGVVGLVAGRIKEKVGRPVIAFACGAEGELRGSARSIPGLHIRDVLQAIATREPDLISRFGGHAMAAGLTLGREKLERFARAFDEEVVRAMGGCPAAHCVETDGELAAHEIALDTAAALREGGPWGQAFPEPCFDGLFAVKTARVVAEKHLKMWVELPGARRTFDAIAFNHLEEPAARAAELPLGEAQLVYRLDINEYQGERRLQLLVDHVLPASSPGPPGRA
ncbi:MAG TPA: single-stranded-DNA-specific exonuclease RecJ [Steroidobacteraceae bacterium]|nr:single-stranded-DNA-specific exonuclease RecJ [Steroidobacteraceae bacterium]